MNDIDIIKSDFKEFKDKIIDAANLALKVGAKHIEEEAINLIRMPSNSGKTVKRGNKRHTISRRGDAPNNDSGDLKNSLIVEEKHLHVSVKATMEYAIPLETHLERPFLSTAFKNQKPQIVKNIAKASKAAFK